MSAPLSVLREARDSVAKRVRGGISGYGVARNAKRIFVCGFCVSQNNYRVEREGAAVVGSGDGWPFNSILVDGSGDPCCCLAKASLAQPYEQSIAAKGQWIAEQTKKSRAGGALCLYSWGCNTQSAVSRPIADCVKRETWIPTLICEHELAGVQPEQEQNRINAFIEMVAS